MSLPNDLMSRAYFSAKYPLFLVHFARWGEVFKLQPPGANDRANCPGGGPEFAQVVWRFARVMALAARAEGARQFNDMEEFQKLDSYLDKYLKQLEDAGSKVEAEQQTNPPAVYLCEHRGLADIYELVAKARVAFLRGNLEEAVLSLRNAVAKEDDFLYMEPPRVYQPVRQCLGYILLTKRRLSEAEEVYREDLVKYPENGWSLHGLSSSLHEQERHADVDRLRRNLEIAWGNAKENIESSCLSFSRSWGGPSLT